MPHQQRTHPPPADSDAPTCHNGEKARCCNPSRTEGRRRTTTRRSRAAAAVVACACCCAVLASTTATTTAAAAAAAARHRYLPAFSPASRRAAGGAAATAAFLSPVLVVRGTSSPRRLLSLSRVGGAAARRANCRGWRRVCVAAASSRIVEADSATERSDPIAAGEEGVGVVIVVDDDDGFIRRDFEGRSRFGGASVLAPPAGETPPSPAAAASSVPEARPFPLGLIVDQDEVKRALLVAAVNPKMGGVVISGRRGTGKSVLARAVHRLLPLRIERIAGNPYNVDPSGRFGIDSFLRDELERTGQKLEEQETEWVPTPFVNIPLNVMEDSLLGTVDLEKSLETGNPVFSPGLLARAHRGVLYVDEINLLEEEAANVLLNVISDGYVTLEREGLSVRYPCRPLLVATYNPAEGELREHLLDRIGVSLSADAQPLSVAQRVEVVDNVVGFSGGISREQLSAEAARALEVAEEEEASLRTAIADAQAALPNVRIGSDQILYLCEEATRAGCEGQRAEIFATEVAKASAALLGRTEVNAADLRTGVLLAIAPRGTYFLQAPAGEGSEQLEPPPAQPQSPLEPLPPPPEEMRDEDQREEEDDRDEEEDEKEDEESEEPESDKDDETQEEEQLDIPQEFMFGVDTTPIDPRLMNFAKWTKRGKGGKRSRIFNLERGRYVKPIFPKGKRGKIAVGATLRAAAPYQIIRRRFARGTSKDGKLVHIDKDDFRIKRMARKAGSLIIFLVDASGSMALNRMDAAKGAAMSLLGEAYRSRDKICLVEFHGERAEVLVPPTKSMALTKNRLEAMPCGGGSPLAHALMTAMRTGLITMKIKQDVGRVVIVLLTDGRANIPLSLSVDGYFDPESDPNSSSEGMPSRDYLREEVMACARQLWSLHDFNLLVIDTEDKFVGTGMAEELARTAGGNYHHLIEADSETVESITKRGLAAARAMNGAAAAPKM